MTAVTIDMTPVRRGGFTSTARGPSLDISSSWSLRYDHEPGATVVTTMPAGEFKTHCLQVMETVRRRRETVIITKRGVPVAKLVPVDLPQPHKVFGCLAQRYEEVGDVMSPILPPEAWDVLK